MRRRYDDDSTPPPELQVFDGHSFATADAWEEAFEEWHRVRNLWLSQRGLPDEFLPPGVVDGDCPFDWSRI